MGTMAIPSCLLKGFSKGKRREKGMGKRNRGGGEGKVMVQHLSDICQDKKDWISFSSHILPTFLANSKHWPLLIVGNEILQKCAL